MLKGIQYLIDDNNIIEDDGSALTTLAQYLGADLIEMAELRDKIEYHSDFFSEEYSLLDHTMTTITAVLKIIEELQGENE